MKRVCVLVIFLLLCSTFVFATGTIGDSCVTDEECFGALQCTSSICSAPSSGSSSLSSSDSLTSSSSSASTSYACSSNYDCYTGYACDSTYYCSADSDGSGYADSDEYGDTCVSHEDCDIGDVCDYTSYNCVSIYSVSIGSCRGSSQCGTGYTCYHRYCIPEMSGGEVQASITPDNPYLGGISSLYSTVRTQTTSDPEVLQQLTQQALSNSNALDQRRAQGIVSDSVYTQGKSQLAEQSVNGLQKAYTVLSEQSLQQTGGNFQQYTTQLQQVNALAQQADTQLASFQAPAGQQGEFAQTITGLRSQINTAQQGYYSESQGGSSTLSCTPISQEGVVAGNFYVSGSDGSAVYLTDSQGYNYEFIPSTSGFSVLGSYVNVYLSSGTFSGSEIDFVYSSTQSSGQEQSSSGNNESLSSNGQSQLGQQDSSRLRSQQLSSSSGSFGQQQTGQQQTQLSQQRNTQQQQQTQLSQQRNTQQQQPSSGGQPSGQASAPPPTGHVVSNTSVSRPSLLNFLFFRDH